MATSRFTRHLAVDSGIGRLMDDLGAAMTFPGSVFMLGRGNPAHIPEVETVLREAMLSIAGSPERFGHMVGNYDPPQGNRAFSEAQMNVIDERDVIGDCQVASVVVVV